MITLYKQECDLIYSSELVRTRSKNTRPVPSAEERPLVNFVLNFSDTLFNNYLALFRNNVPHLSSIFGHQCA